MKKNDIFLAGSVLNIIAGAGLIAVGIIGLVSYGKCGKRRVKHISVRGAKR